MKSKHNMKANKEIRETAKQNGVPYWKIAARLGVSEVTICRWLRMELDEETKREILSIVEQIAHAEEK